MLKTIIVAVSIIVTAATLAATPAGNDPPGCLYAVEVDGHDSTQMPCEDADPLGIAVNSNILLALDMLEINPKFVEFHGCANARFATFPPSTKNSTYIVSYAIEPQKYLAPILHELSHVRQMQDAGGLARLREKYNSKRIELGADYLVGIMFARLFKDASLAEFEQNLRLTAKYIETDPAAHGTPDERDAAFRLGVFSRPEEVGSDIRAINLNFQRNIYANIFRFK